MDKKPAPQAPRFLAGTGTLAKLGRRLGVPFFAGSSDARAGIEKKRSQYHNKLGKLRKHVAAKVTILVDGEPQSAYLRAVAHVLPVVDKKHPKREDSTPSGNKRDPKPTSPIHHPNPVRSPATPTVAAGPSSKGRVAWMLVAALLLVVSLLVALAFGAYFWQQPLWALVSD